MREGRGEREGGREGGRDSIAVEMKELQSDWSKLKDNMMDSLVMLQRVYDDWVRRSRERGRRRG